MFDLFPQVEKSPNSQNLMTDSKTFDAVSSPSLFPPEQKKSTNHFPIPSSTRVLSLQRQNGQFLLSPPVPILSPPSTRLLSEHSVSPPPVFSPHNPHHPAHHFQNVHSDQPPQTKPKSVKFVTSERRKFHRENMKGHVCEKCGNFAAICEQLGVHQHHTDFSRHRHHHTPPATPDAYWDLSLGDSEGIQEENSAEEIESDVDGEWRESDEGEKREKVDP
ncbi:hypothetical protein BLNAU_468 [Blattamonas nauphoetae]|uniref:DNA endonuclease activator Ctp1 C-terminal domain-containing protein n=1 Tax=Blattamonas nauphoetae TaxID=2049346 RepID=A0ABQ9YLD2_9EUKA|nr:hypothetical protein BLNAU_468 [Blattamonas nauphoetae]